VDAARALWLSGGGGFLARTEQPTPAGPVADRRCQLAEPATAALAKARQRRVILDLRRLLEEGVTVDGVSPSCANWKRPTCAAGPDVGAERLGLRSPGASEPEPPRSVFADEDGMVGDAARRAR